MKNEMYNEIMTIKRYQNIKESVSLHNENVKKSEVDVHISKGNDKTRVPSFDTAPEFTCDKTKACFKKGCYAKNLMRYKGVLNAYIKNSLLYIKDPKGTQQKILNKIPFAGMFRWHVSGDILNAEYFNMMVDIAKKRPNVLFMAFTKKFEIVNSFLNDSDLPENLNIIFSHWKGENVPNPNNLPLSVVRFKKDENIHLDGLNLTECPSNDKNWNGSCATCAICWKMGQNKAVVFNQH